MITVVVVICVVIIVTVIGMLLQTISNQGKTINNLQRRLTQKDREIQRACYDENDLVWNEWAEWTKRLLTLDTPTLIKTIKERASNVVFRGNAKT